MIRHLFRNCAIPAAACLLLTGCITEDLQECPNEYALRIVFDRNMLNADALAGQVKSVDVKVYDTASGKQVYRFRDSGGAIAQPGYLVPLPIPAGNYDILCWGGMEERDSFSYVNPAAEELQQQSVKLNTEGGNSDSRLNSLFHGLISATFTDNNLTGSMEKQIRTLPLTKDTNRIQVLLMNLDGEEMKPGDFSMTITSYDALMAYDNSISAREKVIYSPWDVQAIETDITETPGLETTTTTATLSAEQSMARLAGRMDSRLDVYRNEDGERIISIPLESNLLLYKGAFYDYMSDQEYLDRRDDFTITFILDSNNNWNAASMIYINKWATLPIQYQE